MKVLTLLLLYGVFEILPFKSLLQSTLVLDPLFFREFLQEMILVCLHLIKLFFLERRLFLKYPVRKKHEGKNFFSFSERVTL